MNSANQPTNSLRMTDSAPGSALLSHILGGAIHIWYTHISSPPWSLPTLWSVLSLEERDTATSYLAPILQNASILRRGLLRILLSHYLQIPADILRFSTDPLGKPSLVPTEGLPPLSFNLSQSGEHIVYAISRDPVGIDVEQCVTTRNLTALISLFFTDSERTWLTGLPTDQQQLAALRIWTYKEAYCKATGDGVSTSLSTLTVTRTNESSNTVTFASQPPSYHPYLPWISQEIHSIPGCITAVVYPILRGNHTTIRVRELRNTTHTTGELVSRIDL